jgi:SulP family sulfate permease
MSASSGLISRLRGYRGEQLRGDVSSAIVVTTLVLPQGMAYAMLAGLPPQYGIYAAIVPAIVYGLIGTSSHLAVGPVAITALLVAGGLQPLAEVGTTQYVELAMLLSAMVGVMLIILGLVRAGQLVNFLSHPTIVGFTAAAAVLTAMSQVRGITGIPRAALAGESISAENPWPVLTHLAEGNLVSLGVGLGGIAILILLKRLAPKVPAAVVACIAGGGLVWLVHPGSDLLAVVGPIPRALPPVGVPHASLVEMRSLFGAAATVAVLGYGTSIAVAKAIAAKHRERISPDRELIALGAANLAGAFTSSFAVSGSLSRSQVGAQAGGRTQLSGIFAVGLVVAAMFGLAGAFAWLPIPILAAIIIHGALQLFDVAEARAVIRTKRADGITLALTFVATLVFGLVEGLAVGLIIAMLLFVSRTARPHTAELGRIPGTMVYRNVDRFDVETCPQVGILRVDAPLYYANARFLEDRVMQAFADAPRMRLLALECSGVGDLDATALRTLRDLVDALRSQGNDLHFIGAIGPVRDLLESSGVAARLGTDHLHRTILEAAPKLMALISREYCEGVCRVSAFPDCTLIPRARLASEASEKAKFSPQI